MGTTEVERYRQHAVWEVLQLKRDALNSVRYSTSEAEQLRADYVLLLDHALQSHDNPVPFLYDDILDALVGTLNQLTGDEGSFNNFRAMGHENALRDFIRRLPGARPSQIGKRYVAALDSAIEARENELSRIRDAVASLSADIDTKEKELVVLARSVARQGEKISTDAATITQVTTTAADQLDKDWRNSLAGWETARDAKDLQLDREMTANIGLLANAAAVGQRLVEHAAGRLTATEWTQRASRERRNALGMRLGSLAFFVGALAIGGYILWQAVEKGFQLTVGDGILRGALVLALVGVGSFLSAEARRHFREADSAEEVALALTAIEPFYAGADADARAGARDAVGETVFVKNVLSRFSSRDAAKHGSVTNAQMSEILDLLTKSSDLARKVPGS